MKLHYFDAGGSTVAHGGNREAICLSGSVGLFTAEGAEVARRCYGADCLRELREDEVRNVLGALGVASPEALPRLDARMVRDAVQGLIQAFGTASGLAPKPPEVATAAAKPKPKPARPAGGEDGNA